MNPAPSAPALSRLSLAVPARAGRAPALVACTHAERLARLLDALAAGWTGWRGHPWAGAYSRRLEAVAGLHSLRLALFGPPHAVLLETTFEGDGMQHVALLRRAFGPVLDLVYLDADGPQPGDAAFGAWAAHASAGSLAGAAVAEIAWHRRPEGPAAAPDTPDLALHAAGDLHRLSTLYAAEQERELLRRAARCLLPQLPDPHPSVGAHFADAIEWHGDRAQGVEPAPQATALAPVPSGRAVSVEGKALVTEVLLDADSLYSNCGYLERMKMSFGPIYLGLDRDDPRYAAESGAVNLAIGRIGEREAFSEALEATRNVLRPLRTGPALDMKAVSDQVLASLCTLWFDIPDGRHVAASGSLLPIAPGRCPGHFAPPSGFIFQPEPSLILAALGQLDGRILKAAVDGFVTERRRSGALLRGPISRAIFEAFPHAPAQDDLVACTLIGVMMGFLPTTQGNLVAAMERWSGPGFAEMSARFNARPELDIWERANDVIRGPLVESMQAAPVPPAIWRTATRDHEVGSPPVRVSAGDRVHVRIDSAMKEDLARGVRDVWPVFGGDRGSQPHPTHACPGAKMGMGVLLGIFAATMEERPASAPTATRLSVVT